MEVWGVTFSLWLLGREGGWPDHEYLQFPRRRVAEKIQNKAFPFLQLAFLLRILKQSLANGHLASWKASPQTSHFSVYSFRLINGIRTVQLKILHIEGKERGILEATAINSNLKYTKDIFLHCENCVRTGEVDAIILRAVSKRTAFWCWFLSSKYQYS